MRAGLESFVDALAMSGIDAYAHCIFEKGYPLIQDSEYADPHPIWIGGNKAGVGGSMPVIKTDREAGTFGGYPFPTSQGYRPIYKAGEDPISIYAAHYHKHEMKFLSGFCMN